MKFDVLGKILLPSNGLFMFSNLSRGPNSDLQILLMGLTSLTDPSTIVWTVDEVISNIRNSLPTGQHLILEDSPCQSTREACTMLYWR